MSNQEQDHNHIIIETDERATFTLDSPTAHAAGVKASDEVRATFSPARNKEPEVVVTSSSVVIGYAPAIATSRMAALLSADPLAAYTGHVVSATYSEITVSLTLKIHLDISSLTRLEIDAPPMLAQAVGYEGTGRLVGFYWIPGGDEIMWTDGVRSTTGNWRAWLLFQRHRLIAPHLEAFNFGSSDEEAEHWLLVDRETLALYVGFPQAAARVLFESWQHRQMPPPPPFLAQLASKEQEFPTIEEEIERMAAGDLRGWAEVAPPDMELISQLIERDNRLTNELGAWLDERAGQPARKT